MDSTEVVDKHKFNKRRPKKYMHEKKESFYDKNANKDNTMGHLLSGGYDWLLKLVTEFVIVRNLFKKNWYKYLHSKKKDY